MRTAQTSDRISAIAGKWATVTSRRIMNMRPAESEAFAADVRSMAASLLRQDEHKGLRGFVRRLWK